MSHIIDNLPSDIEAALAKRAAAEGKRVDEIIVDVIRGALTTPVPKGKADFTKYLGTWVEDPAFDKAMEDFERVDPELWR